MKNSFCSISDLCALECDDEVLADEPEYYDDEELDRFRGRPAGSYTAAETDEFEEVMTTMRPDEVHGWLVSLGQRGVALPDALKDAARLLLQESRGLPQ